MVNETEKFREEDNKRKMIVEAKNKLESYSYQVKDGLIKIKLKKCSDEVESTS